MSTTQTDEFTANLPELTGSEKQIAWATKIRAKAINTLAYMDQDEAQLLKLAADSPDHPQIANVPMILAAFAAFRERVTAETTCRWWIDNDGNNAAHMARRAAFGRA